MNWDLITAIIGAISLFLALSVEIIKLLGIILDKTKSDGKPFAGFLNSGTSSVVTGILTIFGLSLSALVFWYWGDKSPQFFLIFSLLAVLIGVSLLILGMTTSMVSIRKGSKTTGYIGLTLNAIGCFPLLVMFFFFIMVLFN
jgi:vacuolar-type H+-ATPase subunit I/STV1